MIVRNDAFTLVERYAGQRNAEIAYGTEYQPHRQRFRAVCGARAQGAIVRLVKLVVDHFKCLDVVGSDDLYWRDEEPHVDAALLSEVALCRETHEHLHVALGS